jgi:hypothetical protein
VTPEQVAVDYNKQPELNDKCEYPKHIHQEIRVGVASLEEHCCSPVRLSFDRFCLHANANRIGPRANVLGNASAVDVR